MGEVFVYFAIRRAHEGNGVEIGLYGFPRRHELAFLLLELMLPFNHRLVHCICPLDAGKYLKGHEIRREIPTVGR